MNCSICGGIVAGSQPMSTTLPLCQCQWRQLPDVQLGDIPGEIRTLRARIAALEAQNALYEAAIRAHREGRDEHGDHDEGDEELWEVIS